MIILRFILMVLMVQSSKRHQEVWRFPMRSIGILVVLRKFTNNKYDEEYCFQLRQKRDYRSCL